MTHSNLKGHIRSAICVRASAVTRRRQRSNLDLWIPVTTTRLLRSNRLDEFTPPSRQFACAMRRADSRPWFGNMATLAPPRGYRAIWSCPNRALPWAGPPGTFAPNAAFAWCPRLGEAAQQICPGVLFAGCSPQGRGRRMERLKNNNLLCLWAVRKQRRPRRKMRPLRAAGWRSAKDTLRRTEGGAASSFVCSPGRGRGHRSHVQAVSGISHSQADVRKPHDCVVDGCSLHHSNPPIPPDTSACIYSHIHRHIYIYTDSQASSFIHVRTCT